MSKYVEAAVFAWMILITSALVVNYFWMRTVQAQFHTMHNWLRSLSGMEPLESTTECRAETNSIQTPAANADEK